MIAFLTASSHIHENLHICFAEHVMQYTWCSGEGTLFKRLCPPMVFFQAKIPPIAALGSLSVSFGHVLQVALTPRNASRFAKGLVDEKTAPIVAPQEASSSAVNQAMHKQREK